MANITAKIKLTRHEFTRLSLLTIMDLDLFLTMTNPGAAEQVEVIDKLYSICQSIHHRTMNNPEAIALIGLARGSNLTDVTTAVAKAQENGNVEVALKELENQIESTGIDGTDTVETTDHNDLPDDWTPVNPANVRLTKELGKPVNMSVSEALGRVNGTPINVVGNENTNASESYEGLVSEYMAQGYTREEASKYARSLIHEPTATGTQPGRVAMDMSQAEYAQITAQRRMQADKDAIAGE